MPKFYQHPLNGERFTFFVGNRIVAVHQLDNTARAIEESIGIEITLRRGGAYATGTLDQLDRFAAILDVKHTLDDIDASNRRASITDAKRLRAEIARAKEQR